MKTKLTLSLDKKLIVETKKFASENNHSLSLLVKSYFKSLVYNAESKDLKNISLKAPLTNSLRGVAKNVQ